MKEPDVVTIVNEGTKKFRQQIVDLIYQTLLDEDLEMQGEGGVRLISTLDPSEETAR